jgi:hypothetical protein
MIVRRNSGPPTLIAGQMGVINPVLGRFAAQTREVCSLHLSFLYLEIPALVNLTIKESKNVNVISE